MATQLSQKMKTIFVPTFLAFFVAACTTTNLVTESIKDDAYASSEFYLNKADKAQLQEDKVSYTLLAIRKLIEENKGEEAQDTFNQLSSNVKTLEEIAKNPVQKVEYDLVSAQLSALNGKNTEVQSKLRRLKSAQLSRSQTLRFYATQARIAENQKNAEEIVRARSQMNSYLTDNKARQENNDKIWTTLRKSNRGIEKAKPQAGEMEFAGWIALISLYNQNVTHPAQMPQALNNWQNLYPNHSAISLMPTELKNVTGYQQTQLNNVALLLPLSGDAQILGEIIRNGFMDTKGNNITAVQIYDTDTADITSLLAQAKQNGATMVVGPLLKDRVDELLNSSELNGVNVLALNSTSNTKKLPQVCYYSLSPESEAKAAADKMFKDRQSIALVSAPQDDAGQRSADAFIQRWRQLTGNDADVRYYNNAEDAVASIQSARVSKGGLYVLGNAEQVLGIKQGLDNSPLEDRLTIYTSSRSNSPVNTVDFYTAMEGVKFSEIPLLAEPDSDEYKKAENLAENDFAKMRLYAMGADAWSLANKFNEFSKIPGFKISGLTGNLSAGQNCNIERNLSWLQYKNGTVEQAY